MTIGIREKQSASTKNYEKFITDDFSKIHDEFSAKGYSIHSADDFSTYVGWKEKGRKVKRGEKGVKFESSNDYAQPLFSYDAPVIDPKTGKQQFYKGKKSYTLFALEQTELLK